MNVRMNGFRSERENRPSSETMVELHVYLVPPNIWREKFNNALNQNINDTVSIGLIRVHPETKVFALREEIEQQLGSDHVPRKYVFLKSVGRSLTWLKSKQEVTLKAKNFLPPQAYAPEVYLLEATPEVQQAFNSEDSPRPQTQTSYDYVFPAGNKNAKGRSNQYHFNGNSPGHQLAGSLQHHQKSKQYEKPNEECLQPQITTPTYTGNEQANPDKPAQQGYHGGTHKHDDSYHGSQPNHEDGFYGRQHKHDIDSGIAGFTPVSYRENEPLDRWKREQDVVNDQLKPPQPPPPEADNEESDQLYRPQDEQDLLQWNRRQQEDQETARREKEKRAREEALRKKHENDRQQIAKDAKLMKTAFDGNLTRFPSPPPLRLVSNDRNANLTGAWRKRQKDELLRELEEAKAEHRASEQQKEELVRHAKQMQAKTQNKRNHARDYWKKRYFDEKKKTEPLEEQSNGLRTELDIFHKRLLAILEGPKEKATKLNDPKGNSKVGFPTKPLNNFTIRATRLQHELDDIRHRVENAKMKLTSEKKLRHQAEAELPALRANLIQKKINLTLSRNSHLTAYAPPAADVNFMTARSTGITPRS